MWCSDSDSDETFWTDLPGKQHIRAEHRLVPRLGLLITDNRGFCNRVYVCWFRRVSSPPLISFVSPSAIYSVVAGWAGKYIANGDGCTHGHISHSHVVLFGSILYFISLVCEANLLENKYPIIRFRMRVDI